MLNFCRLSLLAGKEFLVFWEKILFYPLIFSLVIVIVLFSLVGVKVFANLGKKTTGLLPWPDQEKLPRCKSNQLILSHFTHGFAPLTPIFGLLFCAFDPRPTPTHRLVPNPCAQRPDGFALILAGRSPKPAPWGPTRFPVLGP
jgi:hypothetical protein